MSEAPDANGRVTLARIDGKLDNIMQRLESLCRSVDDHEQRIRIGEQWNAVSRTRWERHSEDHDDEWQAHQQMHTIERSVTGGLGAIVTAVLGYLQVR